MGYVVNQVANTVTAIDTATNAIVATIPIENLPARVIAAPNGARAYVTNQGPGTISVIDVASSTVVATIAVGGAIAPLAITPDSATLYTGDVSGNTVTVIDAATNTVVGPAIAVAGGPFAFAMTPDGAHLYVAQNAANSLSIIDTATNTLVGPPIALGARPFNLVMTPDGSRIYAACQGSVVVVDVASNTVVTTIPGGILNIGMAITPNGATVYVADLIFNRVSVIDVATNSVVGASISVGSSPETIAITPDGAFAYVPSLSAGTASIIDTSTNTVVGSPVPVGIHPVNMTIFDPNRPPTASCRDVTVAAGPSCTAAASVDNGSFDPDGDPISLDQSPPGPYSLGASRVTLTVTDGFGNSARCTATVTVVDNTPPTITCPPNITARGNIPNSPFANVDPGTPTAADTCSSLTVAGTRSDGQPLDAPYPFGTTVITQTATDAGGNRSSCQQTITVVANAPVDKDQCKHDGWRTFTNPTFKNQGDCVSFVQHLPSPVRARPTPSTSRAP